MKLLDKVRVRRKDENGEWSTIHRGVVVELTTLGAKVYNPTDKPGDYSPATAEWFAEDAPCIKLEVYA